MSHATPQKLGSLIRESALYHRLKASTIYDIYWRVRNPSIIHERDSEVMFYRQLLASMPAGALIFDIGANQGYKVGIFLRLGARVLAVDPDEANQRILRQRFHALRFEGKPVTIVGKAVSDAKGLASLWVDEPGSAKNTLSRKWVSVLQHDNARFGTTLSFAEERRVDTITIADLVAEHGEPHFVKIDVEGHELGVLRGMRQAVPFLSLEVNLPEFLDDGIQCIRLLHSLEPASRFNFAGANVGNGLLLRQWVDAAQMADELSRCKLPSVEIFCRTV